MDTNVETNLNQITARKARLTARTPTTVTCHPQEAESASPDQPECKHGVGDLGKAGDIRPGDVIIAGAALVAVARQQSWIPGV
jgi:hypothetical protein